MNNNRSYHGTSAASAISIVANGYNPDWDWIFASEFIDIAAAYAEHKAQENHENIAIIIHINAEANWEQGASQIVEWETAVKNNPAIEFAIAAIAYKIHNKWIWFAVEA